MKGYKLHFIRHGKCQQNFELRCLGRTPQTLSEEGKKELALLSQEFTYPWAERVYCSPSSQCVDTASILYPGCNPVQNEMLLDFNFGDYENVKQAQLQADPIYLGWLKGDMEAEFPNGESLRQFSVRCVQAVHRIFSQMMENGVYNAAVVTHGGVIMSVMALLGYPRRPAAEWIVENGRGYTALITPAMWMRDNGFEVFGVCPMPPEKDEGEEID